MDKTEQGNDDALDWLAAMKSHVSNNGEQMVRNYGHYSNTSVAFGKRKTSMTRYPLSWRLKI